MMTDNDGPPGDLSSQEWDEVLRLQRILGEPRFSEICARATGEHMDSKPPPEPTMPFYPGMWRARLVALRAAVEH